MAASPFRRRNAAKTVRNLAILGEGERGLGDREVARGLPAPER